MKKSNGLQNQKHIRTTVLALSGQQIDQANQVALWALAVFLASAFYYYFYFTILRRMLFLPGA